MQLSHKLKTETQNVKNIVCSKLKTVRRPLIRAGFASRGD